MGWLRAFSSAEEAFDLPAQVHEVLWWPHPARGQQQTGALRQAVRAARTRWSDNALRAVSRLRLGIGQHQGHHPHPRGLGYLLERNGVRKTVNNTEAVIVPHASAAFAVARTVAGVRGAAMFALIIVRSPTSTQRAFDRSDRRCLRVCSPCMPWSGEGLTLELSA